MNDIIAHLKSDTSKNFGQENFGSESKRTRKIIDWSTIKTGQKWLKGEEWESFFNGLIFLNGENETVELFK